MSDIGKTGAKVAQPGHAPKEARFDAPRPPREDARRDTLAKTFSSRLDRAADPKTDGSHRASGETAGRPIGELRNPFDERDGESGQGRSEQAAAPPLTGKGAGGPNAPHSPTDTQMLDRMAAQIAEVRGLDSGEAEIKFPAGSLASEASIQRQPDGGLAIRLAGLDPRLGAVREGLARLALIGALERRRVRIASLQFVRGDDQAGRKSTMSRVV